ncbi:hypothetical protein BgiMline_027775 [Biomphalaria glabrata]|nr:hypothetical protein BgiBS90_016324 [Biomphalaria glabrata]
MTKKVPPAWYQRYMSTLPVGEQVFLQPLKELKEEDKMLKDATPHVKSEDKTKELVKALEKEKAMKIEMVLDLVAGDPNKMRDRVALIKPSTNPIKYIQDKKKEEAAAAEFRYADAQGNPLTFTQYLKFMKPNYFKENSKWKLLVENKVIRQKIKHLIKQKYQQEIQQKWRKAIRRVRAVLRFFQIIANIEHDIGQCEQNIGQYEKDKGQCEQDIDQHEKDIDKCEEDIGQCQKDICKCEQDISQCEHGITGLIK